MNERTKNYEEKLDRNNFVEEKEFCILYSSYL